MREKIQICTPMTKEKAAQLRAGDSVELTGIIYTARDAAHKRMLMQYEQMGKLPFDIENQIIYYTGPSPARPGKVVGSAGPTTSYRMDSYTPKLIELGQTGMIGKGVRNQEVIEAMKLHTALYFGAMGGAGALLAHHIKKAEVIAYEDLGTEAIRKLTIEKFPVIVIIDSYGTNLYETEKKKYRRL